MIASPYFCAIVAKRKAKLEYKKFVEQQVRLLVDDNKRLQEQLLLQFSLLPVKFYVPFEITRQAAHFLYGLVSDLVNCNHEKEYDVCNAECHHRDQALALTM